MGISFSKEERSSLSSSSEDESLFEKEMKAWPREVRHKEERENESRSIIEKEMEYDRSFISLLLLCAVFFSLLARLMIGTVKKRLSLDPANKKEENGIMRAQRKGIIARTHFLFLFKLDRQSYSAYHHLLTLITCSNTLFSF